MNLKFTVEHKNVVRYHFQLFTIINERVIDTNKVSDLGIFVCTRAVVGY